LKLDLEKITLHIVMLVVATIFFVPFYWTVIASTFSLGELYAFPPRLIPSVYFVKNLYETLSYFPFFRNLVNSLFVAGTNSILAVTLATLAGYAFAKLKFPGNRILFIITLAGTMFPPEVLSVPLYIQMRDFHWVDTYQALILPMITRPFVVFLMRQNIKMAIHDDLLNSARLDGCSELGIFFRIVLPLIKPAIAAVGVFTFYSEWNSFVWPRIILRTENMLTINVAISRFAMELSRPEFAVHMIMASFLSVIPVLILYAILQKQFVSGLLTGAGLKG